MTWPTVAITTTNLDAGTDSPANARSDLLDAVTKQNQMIAHVSPFAATVLDDTTAAAARATLGVLPGVYVRVTGSTLQDTLTTRTFFYQLPLTVKNYDPNNFFDTATSRFMPNVAGYYFCSAAACIFTYSGGYTDQLTEAGLTITKNGYFPNSATTQVFRTATNPGCYEYLTVNDLVYLNGVDDYLLPFYKGNATANNLYLSGVTSPPRFTAVLVAS